MAITTHRLTYEDLELIPEEHPGDRHELIDGELFVTPAPVSKHQTVSSNVVFALERYVRDHHLGIVRSAPTGVRLAPDTLVIPDACFVSRDRLHIRGAKTIDGPPDLVIEILSPGTRRRDLETKRALYARFAVREFWIIDPDAETVQVLVLTGDKYTVVLAGDDGIITSRVLPELALTLDEVFEDLP